MREHPAVDTYTHGHADPVLQSHRWRTVENSAVAGVLAAFGFLVEPFGTASGHIVRGAGDAPGPTEWN